MSKIVLLEDDEGIRSVLEIVLSSEDYLVESYATIKEFLNRDNSSAADLYLFDVMLPDGSGIDLCNRVRKSGEIKNSPVLLMSAHARLEDARMTCSADDFIKKPFDLDHMLSVVKSHIRVDSSLKN